MEEGRCESGQRRLLVINVPKRLSFRVCDLEGEDCVRAWFLVPY